jgi:phytoene dehydrogenase-like protein
MHTVIIGSGLAGLTAGAALAKAGHQVSIFEQFSQPGGVTAPYEKEGFRWDLGQLLIEGLGPDEPLGAILSDLGVLDQIQVKVDDRRYVFPDFEINKPQDYAGLRWRIDYLKAQFPEDAPGLERYWKDYLRLTSLMTIGRRLEKTTGLVALYWKTRLYLKMLPFLPKKDWTAQQLMDDYFKSEKLKCVFTSILADFFTPPSQFPGLGIFVLNPEVSFDKRMPPRLAPDAEQLYYYSILGGIHTLVKALLASIQSHGGQVYTDRPVARIVVQENRVIGIVDQHGVQVPADVVIASGGAKETFLDLVGEANLPADFTTHLRSIPLMDSVFMVHLGVDFDPAPYVKGVCTYYYGTYDIEGGIVENRQGLYHEGRSGFVVHVPTHHSPSMAPAGQHAMTIYTICPDQLKEGSWAERKEEYADKLIQYAEAHIAGLSQHIRVAEILTPEDFRQRTHTKHHAFGGIAPVMGSWRVPHHTPLQGLYFIGAQSESGGGVNNVIPGAYKTAKAILKANA